MPENAAGTVNIERFLDHDNDVLVAHGRFEPYFKAASEHAERWEVDLDGLTWTMMRQGLAATLLHLASRPVDESVGVTIHIQKPSLNLFFVGDAAPGTATGRVFTEGVKKAPSKMFVQSSRPGRQPTESVIEIAGLDVLKFFEQYYERSEQTQAGFYELSQPDHFAMAYGLPGHNREYMKALTRESLEDWLNGSPRAMHNRVFRFYCGCSPDKIIGALVSMFSQKPDDLFQGDDGVEALCPRCGVRWWIERREFDTAAEEL